MSYLELLDKVEQWAKDRGLDTVEARTQYTKLIEEQGELGLAMLEDNINDDSGVTLIIYCLIRGIDFKKQVEEEGNFWTEYDDLAQKHKEEGNFDVNKVFNYLVFSSSRIISAYNRNRPIEFEHLSVERTMECLHDIAKEYNTTLEETLEMAYNEIKNRKGKMIDGVFVKEEDLHE
ncbi:hypothetical protein A8C38_06105 [Ligilactobacillus salivarius]|uniref:hypothetical protein n=1 Tax=Ligilactobacillus salivarius TaxID=1624 RepID=UPI000A2DE00C|nr:hypothetical protein [Ligilactobacillus salivarius]OTF89899.1 hypothetical protein A8C38_06105 [Ligilactobacillus salivarius]